MGRVTTVAGMHDRGDPSLVHPGPERVKHRITGRPWAGGRLDSSGPHHDGAGAIVQAPLKFGDRKVHVGQGQVRRAEDGAFGTEAPVLQQPSVESDHERSDGLHVVFQQLLVEHAERRKQPDGLKPLLGDHDQAGVTVHVGVRQRFTVLQELQRVLPLGVPAKVRVKSSGPRDRVPRRIGHRVG